MSSIIDIPLDDFEETDVSDNVVSINDALILSLSNLGRVDIDYISNLSKEDYLKVIETLKGSIYQNPETWGEDDKKGWETSEAYLSGNLRTKRKIATEQNNKYKGRFRDNIDALNKLILKTIDKNDIYITLGSTWIPEKYIHEFIIYVLYEAGVDRKINFNNNNNGVSYDKEDEKWKINKNNYSDSVARREHNKFSTKRIDVLDLIEKTLNQQTPVIKDKVNSTSDDKKPTYFTNKEETAYALDAQDRLIKCFQKWIWGSKKRSDDLLKIYDELYCSFKLRQFDGSFLTFPGLNKDKFTLRDYQKNAVARILFSSNTLLSHDVGSGKTFIMIAAGMELKRMGLSNKNLYVVPKSVLMQWKNMFSTLYPNSNVLTITPNDFTPQNRIKSLKDIRDNDYDAILISYSSFENIKLSKEYQSNITYSSKIPDDSPDEIYFHQLNINRLFVDEAHNFKNISIRSNFIYVSGINDIGSKKCDDMLGKVICVQKNNNGGGVIFATGTPISNSFADAYVMQYYLQRNLLRDSKISEFKSWVSLFAEKNTEFEIDIDTSIYKPKTRFSKFHNLDQLTTMLASIGDFHHLDNKDGLPKFNGYKNIEIESSDELKEFFKEISKRAERLRNIKNHIYNLYIRYILNFTIVNIDNNGRKTFDNLLKITSDGRKAALDIRLVKPNSPFSKNSKVYKCAEIVSNIYYKTADNLSTQLIFCDTSTPKDKFNIYDELKRLLIEKNIPESQIAFIHDATKEKDKVKLFKSVSEGKIRILIGSTSKLGTGVNVQEKLKAIHHIDVPWRPSDMIQREGRILRQGNTNEEVEIYRYITKGSFDAYSWQLLETKQKFIDDLLSGCVSSKVSNDISDTVLNYAEVKALAVGDPLIKERVETYNELNKYKILQKKIDEERSAKIKLQTYLPSKIESQEKNIEKIKFDFNAYNDYLSKEIKYDDLDKDGKKKYDEERRSNRELIENSLRDGFMSDREKNILTYKGFNIIIPANMPYGKPYIYLEKSYRYCLEMSDSESGNLIRIDNFLNDLSKYLENEKNKLQELKDEYDSINDFISSNKIDYNNIIKELTLKLAKLDDELGVNKNEKNFGN